MLPVDLHGSGTDQARQVRALVQEMLFEQEARRLGWDALLIARLTDLGIAKAASRGRLALPDDDLAAAMMESVAERLEAAGLLGYELSSFARTGFEAVHNARYWQRLPVLGLGQGAWSTDPPGPGAPFGVRRANQRALPAYLEGVESGGGAEAECEVLAPQVARGEAAFLALRTRRGLAAAAFAREFGASPRSFWRSAIDELCARGLLRESDAGDLALTAPGRLLADSVFEHFV